jgi:uncharacterized caspase-like protein
MIQPLFDEASRRWQSPDSVDKDHRQFDTSGTPVFFARTFVFTAVLIVAGCVNDAVAENFALIVGVNHCDRFRLPDGSRPRPLRAAESDADAMSLLLMTQQGFKKEHIRLLKGEQATRAALENAFREFAAQLKSTDHFVFHFAGHGTQVPDQKPFDEDDGLDEALCLFDSESDVTTLLLDDTLGIWLEDLPAKRITVLLDCCHSGTGLKDFDDDLQSRFLPFVGEQKVLNTSTPKNEWREVRGDAKSLDRDIAAVFACRPEQQAYERRMLRDGESIRAGQFTHFLLEGLQDNAADRNGDAIVSRQEIAAFIEESLDSAFNKSRSTLRERQQPMLECDRPQKPLFPKMLE